MAHGGSQKRQPLEGPSWGQFEQVDDLDSCSMLKVAVESKRLFFVPAFLSPEAAETLDSLPSAQKAGSPCSSLLDSTRSLSPGLRCCRPWQTFF